MPSFEFADSPTRLDLALAAGGGEQTGGIHATLRNNSSRRQAVRIRVEPLGGARAEWFTIAGAAPTSPLEIEQDIDAGSTLTVNVTARIPPGAPGGSHGFRLRVTSEEFPDTDFAEGPAVAFDVAAPKPADVQKPKFPWWAVAAAVTLVLVVGSVVGWFFWPRDLDVALVRGKPFADAKLIAAERGFPDVKAVPGEPAGHDPAQQIVVNVSKDATGATVLLVDPGIPVPDVARQPAVAAARRLIDAGILPNENPQFDSRSDFADGVAVRTIPPATTPVALGGSVAIVLNNKPNGGGGVIVDPVRVCRNFRDCLQVQQPWTRDILPDTVLRQIERVRPGR